MTKIAPRLKNLTIFYDLLPVRKYKPLKLNHIIRGWVEFVLKHSNIDGWKKTCVEKTVIQYAPKLNK